MRTRGLRSTGQTALLDCTPLAPHPEINPAMQEYTACIVCVHVLSKYTANVLGIMDSLQTGGQTGREGGREGGRKEVKEGEKEGDREGKSEGKEGREGGKEEGREGEREGRRETEREGKRAIFARIHVKTSVHNRMTTCVHVSSCVQKQPTNNLEHVS